MSNTDEEYLEAAKTNEITNRQMKHVEVKGKEILIANINRKLCIK
jgi:hypothetical protein